MPDVSQDVMPSFRFKGDTNDVCICGLKEWAQARVCLFTLCPHESRALIHSCKHSSLRLQVFERQPLRLHSARSLCSGVAPSSSQMPYLLATASSQQSAAVPHCLKRSLGASLNCLFCLPWSRWSHWRSLPRSCSGVLLSLTPHHLRMSPVWRPAMGHDWDFPSDEQKLHWWNYARAPVCRLLAIF